MFENLMDQEFPFRKKGSNYLNTSGLSIPPMSVLRFLHETYIRIAINPELEFDYDDQLNQITDHFRNIMNQKSESFSFLRNVTEGLMIAAQSVTFNNKDEIIVTSLEHRVALNCWKIRQQQEPKLELKIVEVKITPDYTSLDIILAIKSAINKKTKVICIPHIDRYYGIVFPVERICSLANENNIYSIVDGAQTLGLIDVDFDYINCDIYLSCLHKWYLAPMTLGTISVNSRVFNQLLRSYASSSRWGDLQFSKREFGGRELGTRNVALEHSIGELITFHNRFDDYINTPTNIKEYFVNELAKIPGVIIIPTWQMIRNYGIVTFYFEDFDTKKIINLLKERYQIIVGISSREIDMLRVSLFFYNTYLQVDELLNGLQHIISADNRKK